MYLDHFGLKEAPFSITPDPRFVFLSDRHRDALAHLVYGISQGGGGGFVQLTGEVGTGKTTLSRLLLAQLPQDTRIALVLNPRLNPIELLETVCEELHLDIAGARGSGKALVDTLNRYLIDAHAQELKVVLVLDEAQQLSVEALEQVRLLTNLETATQKLLQIILLGQPELRELLQRPDLRQLAQRITARYHLTPLDAAETAAYVEHRLAVAGRTRRLYSASALRVLHQRSGGVPRLINVIAERSLLAGYARDAEQLDARLVAAAADELLPASSRALLQWPGLRPAAFAGLALTLALAGLAWWYAGRMPDPAPGAVLTEVGTSTNAAVGAMHAPSTLARVLAVDADDAGAARALLERWDAPRDAARTLAGCPFRVADDLYCTRSRGTLAQLATLDRPVLLQIPDDGGERAVALVGLDAERARIDPGTGAVDVTRSELAAAWPGEYLALMRLPETTEAIRSGPLPGWARAAIDRFEANRSLPPLSEQEPRIQRLQRSHGLRADGIAGPETWWALSSWLEVGPRLAPNEPNAAP